MSQKKDQGKKMGFTLVELMVVVGIMSVIMLLVGFNSRRFNDDLILRTAATDVSLALRQAQSFGISVKESSGGSATFTAPYGAAFDLTNPTYTFIYSDTNNNRAYNGTLPCTGTDECREKALIRGAVQISRLCASYLSNGVLSCFAGNNVRYLIFTYVRPNPEPVIKLFDSNGAEIVGPWKTGYVELVSQKGTLMYVSTDSVSGVITIQNTIP